MTYKFTNVLARKILKQSQFPKSLFEIAKFRTQQFQRAASFNRPSLIRERELERVRNTSFQRFINFCDGTSSSQLQKFQGEKGGASRDIPFRINREIDPRIGS